jgi:hypothetical protein
MTMVATIDLGLDLAGGAGCLPLEESAVQETYARFGLYPGPAVRALALREPGPRVEMPEPVWVAPPTQRRHPALVPTAPEPVGSVQEALF